MELIKNFDYKHYNNICFNYRNSHYVPGIHTFFMDNNRKLLSAAPVATFVNLWRNNKEKEVIFCILARSNCLASIPAGV